LAYFRSKGKVLDVVLLKNEESGDCIDDLGRDLPCNRYDALTWIHYENGEFVNTYNNQCLDVANYDANGIVATYYCDN